MQLFVRLDLQIHNIYKLLQGFDLGTIYTILAMRIYYRFVIDQSAKDMSFNCRMVFEIMSPVTKIPYHFIKENGNASAVVQNLRPIKNHSSAAYKIGTARSY